MGKAVSANFKSFVKTMNQNHLVVQLHQLKREKQTKKRIFHGD